MARSLTLTLLFVAIALPAMAQDNLESVPTPDPRAEQETLQLMDGFEVNLFAADPLIEKPIQMTWDEDGRLWVVGSNIYPHLLPGQPPNDKVYVLDDLDGDGQADQSTVFADGLLTPTGIAVGDGGVYVANSTEILHIRDRDGDGYGEDRRVVLRGFGADDTHHIIHSFRWAPDGMMYFNQSIYIFSHIETPWGVRRLRQGGIWHFRPETMRLDVFSTGFVNPWGHEFDAWGQSFATDGAYHEGINHVFPGAAFVAAYQADRILAGMNPGQPKHSGLAILSGRHLPDSLQGHMIANDFRANRVNRFAVEETPEGSYRSTQREDLIWTDNIAFRPVDVTVGPDGAIYLADWYNPIIQHGEVDFRDPRRDRVHGRIWRITAKDRPVVTPPALRGASVEALLEALDLPEEWTRIQARRLLKERGADAVLPALRNRVASINRSSPDAPRQLLESLWLHQALDVVAPELLREVLASSEAAARAAAVRVLYHWQDRVPEVDALLAGAVRDPHRRVRREAVSALGPRGTADAARTALLVLEQPVDEELDYALWHTLRMLQPAWYESALADPAFFRTPREEAFALMAVHTPEAITRVAALYAGRTLPDDLADEALELLARYGTADDLNLVLEGALSGDGYGENERIDYLTALEEAEATPSNAPEQIVRLLTEEGIAPEARVVAARLIGTWQITDGRDVLRAKIVDETSSDELRQAAITGLGRLEDPESRALLDGLTAPTNPPEQRISVAAILAGLDPAGYAPRAMSLMNELPASADAKPLFQAFYRSEDGRMALQEALQATAIPAEFATAGLAAYRGNRQRDRDLLAALEASGGVPPVERMPQDLGPFDQQRLEMDVKAIGDPARGEAIYRRPELGCQRCHAVGGGGGLVGPDLSSIGASAPTDYIIEALLKPEVAVKDGYALMQVRRTDGSLLLGMLVRETGDALLLRDAADQVIRIPTSQVASREILPGSLMPAGLTANLEREEFIDLVAFLARLGEPGDYRLSTDALVRSWEVAMPSASGETPPLPGAGPVSWQPAYSLVSGELPLDEIPLLETPSGPRSLVRFHFETSNAGEITFQIHPSAEAGLYVNGSETPAENGRIQVPAGRHVAVLVIGRGGASGAGVRIQVDAAGSQVPVVLNPANE